MITKNISKTNNNFWFLGSNILSLRVPEEGYSRNASCALNLISTFLLNKKSICHIWTNTEFSSYINSLLLRSKRVYIVTWSVKKNRSLWTVVEAPNMKTWKGKERWFGYKHRREFVKYCPFPRIDFFDSNMFHVRIFRTADYWMNFCHLWHYFKSPGFKRSQSYNSAKV
jgi:hypothetical protein